MQRGAFALTFAPMRSLDSFRRRLQEEGPILFDGAMGTMLYARGVPMDACFDAVNRDHPELVQGIHLDYIRAGAEVIETNTFGANRIKLASYGLENQVRELNYRGAKIAKYARDISGKPVWIAGSVGPLGKPLAPIGVISEAEAFEAFREQVEALVEGGVDLLVLETFSDLQELRIAVEAARQVTDLPIVAQMTFQEDGLSLRGNSPEEFAQTAEHWPVDVIGVNCSMGPQLVHEFALRILAHTSKPVSALPNAGLPAYREGRYFYPSSPEYMARYGAETARQGVKIVGGCCGTTPEHIRLLALALKELRQKPEKGNQTLVFVREWRPPAPTEAEPQPTELARKLGKTFVISVEVDPPKGFDPTKDLEGARLLKEKGADVINVADSPLGRARMSALAMAILIQHQVGIETILHFTTRDRNLMGLQADLLGAHALGIRNILALTGDPPHQGDYPNVSAVYDLDSIGLVRLLRAFNEGRDISGKELNTRANFLIGVALDMDAPDREKEMDRFRRKIEAGAHFAMTQPIYDPEVLHRFRREFGPVPIPVLVGILPLHSYRHAEFLHHEVAGINIPEEIRLRLKEAGKRGREVGLRLAEELLQEIRDHVDGIYIMPSFGRYEHAATLVELVR